MVSGVQGEPTEHGAGKDHPEAHKVDVERPKGEDANK